jgi:hypothetical protein
MQICQTSTSFESRYRLMHGLIQSLFLKYALLVTGLTSFTLSNSVSGLDIQHNTAHPVASKISMRTQNVAQINNPINSNPFEEIHKLNFSNTLISQYKPVSKVKPDINSIKVIIKSDINNHFKLPIDIPFP